MIRVLAFVRQLEKDTYRGAGEYSAGFLMALGDVKEFILDLMHEEGVDDEEDA